MKRGVFVLGLAAVAMGCAPSRPIVAPPAPTLPSISTYDEPVMIFFDFEKANLTDRAEEVVQEARRRFAAFPNGRELATAYCDTAEMARDCPALATRRANTVRVELIRLGIDGARIETQISTELLVPTAPNTREPQNRRVQIEPI